MKKTNSTLSTPKKPIVVDQPKRQKIDLQKIAREKIA